MARHDALFHARWRAATNAVCRCSTVDADNALDAVLERYREPHRRYHGVVHVGRVVETLHELVAVDGSRSDRGADDDARVSARDRASLVLAAVYHDAVYDPRSSTNEADSARWAGEELRALGADESTVERVHTAILATAGHVDAPSITAADPGLAALLDADLAVLGSDPADYQAYANGVRAEYAHLDDRSWREGRRRVIEALLARDPLYITAEARRRWHVRSRANLTAELRRLDPTAGPS